MPYFLPISVSAAATHTFLGTVTIDVLLGAVVLAAWHAAVGPALAAYAPQALSDRLGHPHPARWDAMIRRPARLPLILVALALGAMTHLGWDEFTHQGMWGPANIAVLARQYGGIPGYAWAQHVSGLLGGAVIAWWCLRWWRSTAAAPPHPSAEVGAMAATMVPDASLWPNPLTALVTVVCASAVGICHGVLTASAGSGVHAGFHRMVFLAGTHGAGAAAGAAILLSLLWRLRQPGDRIVNAD